MQYKGVFEKRDDRNYKKNNLKNSQDFLKQNTKFSLLEKIILGTAIATILLGIGYEIYQSWKDF